MMADELLTCEEVAAALRVNVSTVRRWIKNGSLDALTLPHRGKREIYRIRRSTLDTVLVGQQLHPHPTNTSDVMLKLHLNEEQQR